MPALGSRPSHSPGPEPPRAARFAAYSYDRVAWCYDALAALYSMGRIGRSRRHHLARLEPGDRVLYAGVGRGREAIAAARLGAKVTGVDLAPGMLARIAREAEHAGVSIDLVEAEVSRLDVEHGFDWVVAHYFLNLFETATARAMLRALVDHTRPGGRLCLADFAPAPEGRRLAAWGTRAYYGPLNAMAATLGFCARHPIPDLVAWLEDEGLRVVDQRRFPLLGTHTPAYWAVIAERPEDLSESGSGEVPGGTPGANA